MMPRRLTYAPLLAAVAAAALSGIFVAMATWKDIRPGLLTALSVIAAATLVRLNRGLPFNNPDNFSLEEARSVIANIVYTVRSLRALIFVTIFAMIWIVVAPALAESLPRRLPTLGGVTVEMVLSGMSAFLLAYAVVRMFQVVQSDVELAILQGKILERSIQKKSAAAFEKQTINGNDKPRIAGVGGFGRQL